MWKLLISKNREKSSAPEVSEPTTTTTATPSTSNSNSNNNTIDALLAKELNALSFEQVGRERESVNFHCHSLFFFLQ